MRKHESHKQLITVGDFVNTHIIHSKLFAPLYVEAQNHALRVMSVISIHGPASDSIFSTLPWHLIELWRYNCINTIVRTVKRMVYTHKTIVALYLCITFAYWKHAYKVSMHILYKYIHTYFWTFFFFYHLSVFS